MVFARCISVEARKSDEEGGSRADNSPPQSFLAVSVVYIWVQFVSKMVCL